MSQQRTRWPSSTKATARFSVVVVLATPPFWLANAITLLTTDSDGSGDSYAPVFARGRWNPPPLAHTRRRRTATPPSYAAARALSPGQAPRIRHREGRCGQVECRARPRNRCLATWTADGGGRALGSGAHTAGVRACWRALP